MTLRLLLVRHGLSTFNKEGRIQGRNDLSTLTSEGKEQAIKAGKTLTNISIDSIYSSPLKRARETTEILVKQRSESIKPIYTDDLLEIDLGPWSGMTKEELNQKFPEAVSTWKKRPKELIIMRNNGSTFKPIKELFKQANSFLEKLINNHTLNKNQSVLIVAHNAILRCILIQLLGDPDQGFRRLQLDNTSISVININSTHSKKYSVQIECLNSTAHLHPALPEQGNKSRLILVRHGETNWNKDCRFQGQIDIPLNENGKKQAAAAEIFLKDFEINRAFTSSMSRPKETAEIILRSHQQIELKQKPELIEIGHGLWEGKLEEEIKGTWPDLLESWQNKPEKVQMPEGENIHDVWNRSTKCWAEICNSLKEKETALVVAHDAVNKTILCYLLGLSSSDIWMVKQGNGAINVIDISKDPEIPDSVTCLNLTSHLGGVLDNTASGAL